MEVRLLREALRMSVRMSNLDLLELVDALSFENLCLRKENEDLREASFRASRLAFEGALVSDRMKLDLILNGCLVVPRKEGA